MNAGFMADRPASAIHPRAACYIQAMSFIAQPLLLSLGLIGLLAALRAR